MIMTTPYDNETTFWQLTLVLSFNHTITTNTIDNITNTIVNTPHDTCINTQPKDLPKPIALYILSFFNRIP